jgi:hypothetical protein
MWEKPCVIFGVGKEVDIHYVDTLTNPFENIKFEDTDKESAEELKR